VELVAINIDDANQVLKIEKEVQQNPWSLNSIESHLNHPKSFSSGVKVGGTLSAFILALMFDSEVHILNLSVSKEHQRKGFGTELLNACFVGGIDKAFLEVRASNKAAISLYRKNGFKLLGTRKNYYTDNKEDAHLFELELSQSIVPKAFCVQNR